MQTLDVATAAAASTGVFETLERTPVAIHITSTWGGGIVTMQQSFDKGTNWITFSPGGVDETFGADQTNDYEDLPGGCYWRFTNDATAAATTVRVSSPRINVNV